MALPVTQKELPCISRHHLFMFPVIISSWDPTYLTLYRDVFRAGKPAFDSRQG
jgi:hypothetical protein